MISNVRPPPRLGNNLTPALSLSPEMRIEPAAMPGLMARIGPLNPAKLSSPSSDLNFKFAKNHCPLSENTGNSIMNNYYKL